MERSQKTHRPSDFTVRRVHPVFMASPSQSTRVSWESTVSSSLVRSVQDRNRADWAQKKGKDQDNQGFGHRLLNMMRKTLMETENNELNATPEKSTLVPFGDVDGCLAVHIKNCRHFLPLICLKYYTNLYIRISVNDFVKYTKSFSLLSGNSDKNITIKFDEMKFFSIQVPRHQDDKWNNISLQLVQYNNTENYLLLLGSATVHLYAVIQKMCFTEELQMLNENTCVCRLDVEFMFAYGSFGYGFSHQLKPLQRNIEPTMFLNVASHSKAKDLTTNVITPQPVSVGNSTLGQHSSQPRQKQFVKPRERLEKMKKEYRNLSTWKEKADYLQSVLTPELEHKNSEETNINKMPESPNNSQYEKKSEEIIRLYFPVRGSRAETTPIELLGNEKKDPTIPTVKLQEPDDLIDVAPRTDESTPPPTDIPLPIIPTLKVVEEGETSLLGEQQSKAVPEDKMKNTLLPPVGRLRNTHTGILKRESSSPKRMKQKRTEQSSSEQNNIPKFINKASFDPFLRTIDNKIPARSGKEQDTYKNRNILFAEDVEYEDQDPPYLGFSKTAGYSSSIWASDPRTIPKVMSDRKNTLLRRVEIDTIPTEVPEFTNKDSLDPFLRTMGNQIPARSGKKQDMCKKRNILFAEDIEYEDQDPPYTASSKIAGSPSTISYLLTIEKTISDTKDKLSSDPPIHTTNTLDSQNKLASNANIAMKMPHSTLKERLQSASLPSFIGESSMIRPENKRRLSKSLSSPSHVENLKQLGTLKSILIKSLQNLSDTLFGKSEICKNTQVIDKSSSPSLSIHKEPSHSLEDDVFKSLQDLNTWLSEKHILNSKALLCDAVKSISADLQSEGKPGKSLEGKGHDSEKHLDASEIKIPVEKKSSFKRKHLLCETLSCESDVHSLIHDCVIKEIFTAPDFPQLEARVKELSKTPMKQQERSLSSKILLHSGDKDAEKELAWPHSAVSQIVQTLPTNAVSESGLHKVMELGKEHQVQPLLHTASAEEELQDATGDGSGMQSKTEPPSGQERPEIPKAATAEEELQDATGDGSGMQSKTEPPSGQERPEIPKAATAVAGGVEPTEGSQNALLQDSNYHSTPHKKPYGTSKGQRLDGGENDLNSTLESLRGTLMGTLNETEAIMLTSLSKSIFNVFFKPSQSERRRQPEKELETLTLHSYPSDTEYLEKIQGNFNKAGRKPFLSPKLHRFLEELSESEIKGLTFELSKHIQHYLVEKLSEAGHIPKEDLPKIYQNLYSMHENTKLRGQNLFQDKYSETVKEIVSFIKNLKINFIDKNLEIKLRSFLNEILQSYLLKDYSESSLLTETESAPTTHSKISSPRAKSTSKSFSELGQDISTENFDRRLEVSMKYPLDKSLQNYLTTLTEAELLSLKENLSRQLQSIFIEKLLKSGLLTKKQLKEIIQSTNLLNSSSSSSKYIKTDLPSRGENSFIEEHSEKQNKCLKTSQSTTAQNITEHEHMETEFIRKEEKEYSSLHNSKENTSTLWQQKNDYSREGSKALSLIKTQLYPNTIQEIPLNISSERLTNRLLKKHKKEYGSMQPLPAEISMYRTETEDSYSRDGKLEAVLSRACFTTTMKANPVEKREHINTYTLTLQKNLEKILLTFPRIPYGCTSRDSEDYLNSSTFSLDQAHTSTHFNFETKEQATFDQYVQRLRENNNNNKKHPVTFGQYQKAIETLYMSQNDVWDECVKLPESESFKYKGYEENSKSFLFPEMLKRENIKVQKERKCASKFKKSSNNIGRLLPNTLPTTTTHRRKSVPKTLLHWTARTIIHDCLDKYEDFYGTPPKQPTKTKSRTRLVRKNSDCSHHQGKPAARPYTALEPNKRESHTGKFPSARMVSAGLIHIDDTTLDHTVCNMWPPKIKRRF